jgi:flagellar basal body-associated protein FliL
MADEINQDKKEEGKKSNVLIRILLVTIAVVGITVISSIVTYILSRPQLPLIDPIQVQAKEPPPPPLHSYDFGNFVTHIYDRGYDERYYIKIKVVLGYDANQYDLLSAELGEREAQIEDLINTILISQTTEVETKEGKKALKLELLTKINHLLRNGKIEVVWLPEFVITRGG